MISALSDSPDGLDVIVLSSNGQRLQMTFLMTTDANPKIRPEVSIEPESENVVLDRIRQLVQDKSKADAFYGVILIGELDTNC